MIFKQPYEGAEWQESGNSGCIKELCIDHWEKLYLKFQNFKNYR